jgi:2-deoxy-D-gluconate 3-dehydrogenase
VITDQHILKNCLGAKPSVMTQQPINNLFDISGKVALVTGASGGIGIAVCNALAERGARLALVDINASALENQKKVLMSAGASVETYLGHVEKKADCENIAAAVVGAFGTVDILVNLAGINTRMRPELYDDELWSRIIDVNLKGTFNMCQAVFPAMQMSGRGKIVNIGSILALSSNAVTAAYSASKGGVLQLTRSLACAWATEGINVNVLQPGWIDTKLSRQARIDIPGHAERVVNTTPLGRWGEPADLIGPVIFPASPASDFMTGASVVVDGGVLAHV